MRKRWLWTFVLSVTAVAAVVAAYAGTVRATPAQGFSGKTLATAKFGNISTHVQTQDPQFWNMVMQTRGSSDLYVQENTWQPGGSTGWHTHPGPSFIIVTEGSVTVYDGDDPTCTPHVYSATDTAHKSFIDIGGGDVHIVRNETNAVAKAIAVQFVPAGAIRRVDMPAPGNCAF